MIVFRPRLAIIYIAIGLEDSCLWDKKNEGVFNNEVQNLYLRLRDNE